jgi:hypothetical protein
MVAPTGLEPVPRPPGGSGGTTCPPAQIGQPCPDTASRSNRSDEVNGGPNGTRTRAAALKAKKRTLRHL